MNYLRHYCNLIRKAENRTPPEGYTEKHHTFPDEVPIGWIKGRKKFE